jgi:hypothetical protein
MKIEGANTLLDAGYTELESGYGRLDDGHVNQAPRKATVSVL